MLLLVKGDPTAKEEHEALDREVNCLETYLEAAPSLCVLGYLKKVNPQFLNTLGIYSFYRPYLQTCLSMTLFLRSGPCFILPRQGLFGGILTWRFFAIHVLNALSFKIKFDEAQFNGETYIMTVGANAIFGIALAFFSMRGLSANWIAKISLVLKFPPILILPIFGFVTFGPTPKGEDKTFSIISLEPRGRSHGQLEMDVGQLCRLPSVQQIEISPCPGHDSNTWLDHTASGNAATHLLVPGLLLRLPDRCRNPFFAPLLCSSLRSPGSLPASSCARPSGRASGASPPKSTSTLHQESFYPYANTFRYFGQGPFDLGLFVEGLPSNITFKISPQV